MENVVDRQTGLLRDVQYVPSPNHNERPLDTDIDLLVIHGISLPPRQFGSDHILDFFQNQLNIDDDPAFADIADLQVSAHLLIRRDGQLVQFVPFHLRAWHAGLSQFDAREGCNDFSIGIELEGCDDIAYTEEQYQQLAKVSQQLIQEYAGITPERIVGHSDIAPGRKTDPGPAFDWLYYRELLAD